MTPLFHFLLINLAAGAAIGLVTGFAFIQSGAGAGLFEDEPLATAMLLWSFVASFAMGTIGTGLALLPYE